MHPLLTWLAWVAAAPLILAGVLAIPALCSLALGQRLFARMPLPLRWRRAAGRHRPASAALVVAWGASPWLAAASGTDARISTAYLVIAAISGATFARLLFVAVPEWLAEGPATALPSLDISGDPFFADVVSQPVAFRALRRHRGRRVAHGLRVWLSAGLIPAHLLARGMQASVGDGPAQAWMLAYLTLVIAAWLGSWAAYLAERRAAARVGLPLTVDDVAAELGLRVFHPGDVRLRIRWPQTPLLDAAVGAGTMPVMLAGRVGARRVWVVEERARVRERDRLAYTVQQWVALCALPGVQLPRVSIGRRETFTPGQLAVGGLAVESEAFNRGFHVACEDPRYAHAILHPRLVEHLETALPDGAQLVIAGDAVSVWTRGALRPWNVPAAVACATGVASLIPRFVALEHRAGAPVAKRHHDLTSLKAAGARDILEIPISKIIE